MTTTAASSSTYSNSIVCQSSISSIIPNNSNTILNCNITTKLINENEIFTLNVGGQSFKFCTKTLITKFPDALLAQFAKSLHENRLTLCDGYFEKENSYFFERSPHLFEAIYKLYVNSNMQNDQTLFHRPLDVCEIDFIAELKYWQILHTEIAPCCSYLTKPLITANNELFYDNFNLHKKDSSIPIRKRISNFCEGDGSIGSTLFTFISIFFVLVSVIGLVMGSIHEFQIPIKILKTSNQISNNLNSKDKLILNDKEQIIWEPHPFFSYLESICIIWFTIEYFLRLSVSSNQIMFIFQLVNIVDLIAILPFYLEMFLALFGFDVTKLSDIKGAFLVVRIMRVLRVVRILKLGRYSSGMRTFAITLKSSARQLGMMGMVLLTGIIFFSTLLYFVEKDEPHTPFTSIPAAFWWAIVTMSTVGYGDYVPATISGKLIASGAILSGVLVLALPITIIVDNFMKVSGSQNMFSGNNPFCHTAPINQNFVLPDFKFSNISPTSINSFLVNGQTELLKNKLEHTTSKN